MNSSRAEHWLKVISHLKVDRRGGSAPHKPLLLLVVAEKAEKGELTESLALDGALAFQFFTFFSIVAARRTQKPNVRLPLYHLKSEGVWEALDGSGEPAKSRELTESVRLDAEFFECLGDALFRERLRRILISRYFGDAGERDALYELVGLPIPPHDVIEADAKRYEATRQKGRDARFKLIVIPAYKHSCALFKFHMTTTETEYIVDACHIHKFALSRNDDPCNGIALCKNAHWAFDQGLWSIAADFKIMVAEKRFDESGEDAFLLKPKAGQFILLPEDRKLRPAEDYLKWHRTQIFNKSRRA